jgi:hypothetical protein
MSDTRWVSQSEAARLETAAGRPVAQSSISRFLDSNPDVPTRRTAAGKVQFVDYEALSLARGASLSVQDKLAGRERHAPPAHVSPEPPRDATSRKRAAEAENAELNLAERKGEVISRAAVTMAVEAAGAAFVQALERRRKPLAQRVATLGDVRAVELELKSADREMLSAVAELLAGVVHADQDQPSFA